MNRENYHQDTTRVSNSQIGKILRSPAHYWQAYLSPSRLQFDSQAFKLGRAFHVMVSEPHRFHEEYLVSNQVFDRRTRDGKAAFEAFSEASQGRIIIPANITYTESGKASGALSYEQIVRMRDAVHSHPIGARLMRSGKAETIQTWQDTETQIYCKSMRDWVTEDGIIVDFKSTDDASPAGFRKSVFYYGYDRQAAFYLDGHRAATGTPAKAFIFLVVEKAPPYICEAYSLSGDVIDAARENYRSGLRTLKECLATGDWHGYNKKQTITVIDL